MLDAAHGKELATKFQLMSLSVKKVALQVKLLQNGNKIFLYFWAYFQQSFAAGIKAVDAIVELIALYTKESLKGICRTG